MKIRVWGARGSIPTPLKPEAVQEKICQAILGLPDTLDTNNINAIRAYVAGLPLLQRSTAGGNTSCIEIQAQGETFIIDAGSGIRELGLSLMSGPCGKGQGKLHLFFSHPHWDHIQGFPFFVPAFIPGNQIFIYSIHNLETALTDQQRPLNFPVSLSYMQAERKFINIKEGEAFNIGPVKINTLQNAHPGTAYSYRFETRHSAFVFASDAEYHDLSEQALRPRIEFFRNADAIVFDAQYTLKEAWQKEDWGHSSAMIGVDLARKARAKKLLLFHHDPTYTDEELQQLLETALVYQEKDTSLPPCEVLIAHEGLTLDLTPRGTVEVQVLPNEQGTVFTPMSVFDDQGVSQLARQLENLSITSSDSSPIIDLSQVETLPMSALKSLMALHRSQNSAQLVLASPSANIKEVIKLSGYLDFFAFYSSVQEAREAIKAREALNLPGHLVGGRYRIERKVGEGQLGAVLEATDIHSGQTVAIKIFSPSFSNETINRFMDQTGNINNLDHPNIVDVFHWSKDGGLSYKVEEFVPGDTLQNILQKTNSRIPAEQAIEIVQDILYALEYAHSRGIVHGDIKPQNIFITGKEAKLSGFGLGLLEESRNLQNAPLLFLTSPYLAPEQILGQPIDHRTDLYALGVLMYQLFCGRLPFSGSDAEILEAHLHHPPQSPQVYNPDLSSLHAHLILKLMAKNPNNRYASAQQARRINASLRLSLYHNQHKHSPRLIGREKELKIIKRAWNKAKKGNSQLIIISGESGIGKTSMALQAVAQLQPKVLFFTRCRNQKGNPPAYLFVEAIASFKRQNPNHPLNPALQAIYNQLKTDTQFEPEAILNSLIHLIKQNAQDTPWLIIFDDLHWADEASLVLLSQLALHLPQNKLLIIGLLREVALPDQHPLKTLLAQFEAQSMLAKLKLSPLNQTETDQLLTNIWKQNVPPEMSQTLWQETQGNPLYLGELARGLVDDGLITQQEGRWQFPDVSKIRLPNGVREAIWRRIRHLGPDTQTLLRQASVLGRAFSIAELSALSDLSQSELLNQLDMALERQIIVESPDNGILQFSHAEIQYVLYADIGIVQRRILHHRVGQALEQSSQATTTQQSETLAFHFSEAGETEKAASYSLISAQKAQNAQANYAALYWYNKTLEELEKLAGEAQTQSSKKTVYLGLAQTYQKLKVEDKAEKFYKLYEAAQS